MQIASTMGGFSLGQADILRKAMGKKQASVMTSMRDKFLEGARRNKIPDKIAVQVFDLMQHFATVRLQQIPQHGIRLAGIPDGVS